ncbi:phage tail sheath subtilisin-like domain-containing protein [Brevibacillus sp. NL20B1]|uniref:phage tail sheath subtilisin-like domain-containing protein n=1 Tax=Brevibacillus sp. NL20B1 TaxID=2829799 RepID=UPI001BA4397F|nr:phage tail sheath subtilisin-like domain-containing protein [Brevibacillus sp. NL20B1]MBR8661125.1 phage tail sheath subtilisin-like domain-containing protein [Brevibacillus sp. NL20B1]
MAAGTWDPTALPIEPGLYINFQEAAAAAIRGGARGTVAIPLLKYGANATAKQFYRVSKEKEAQDLFGADNIASIRLALMGGARDILVYTMPTDPQPEDYADMRDAFDSRQFNVFVFDQEADATEQDLTKAWVERNHTEGKHFMFVAGGTAEEDADPALGNARSTRLKHDYIVNLIVGGTLSGKTYTSAEYAPYLAGLIAGTAINRSITYAQVALEDVNKRLTTTQVREALEAGSLVLIHDGEKVKVVTGLVTSGKKIRVIRARQAIATDITMTAADAYIGKIDNNPDGQAALISAIKAYLERLEANNVLMDPAVMLDPENESVGDSVFLLISFAHVDSIERIFLTINV